VPGRSRSEATRDQALTDTSETLNGSSRVGAQEALSAVIHSSPKMVAQRALRSVLGRSRAGTGVVQRVKINGKEITSESTREEIEIAINWDEVGEWTESVSETLLRELANELDGRKDCDDIVSHIKFSLDDEWSDEDESSNAFANEDFSDDDLGFGRFDPFATKKDPRKELADKFGWEKYPDLKGGYRKIGVHETKQENIGKLVKSGPSTEKLGTGHGLGKGKGFYVTPVGKKKLSSAVSGIAYENHFLAVYIHESVIECQSPDEQHNNVDSMADLARMKAIERHTDQIEQHAEDAQEIIKSVKEGIVLAKDKLAQVKEHVGEIDKQIAEIEKLIKKLNRQLNKVDRIVESMEMHRSELEHPTELYYFIMSGGGEIVIPVESFSQVRAVSSKEDFASWPKG
jgi:archaellum component FlaC